MNYYPHHIGDYLRDTAHLSALEDGIYRRLLDIYYASEKPLPLDLDWLSRLARVKPTGLALGSQNGAEREALELILREFFEKCEDGWRNKRADEEIRKARKRIKAAKSNGKSGGRPKTQQEPSGFPVGSQKKALQKPKAKSQKEETSPAYAVPEWVPQDDWKAFEDSRRKLRKPMTDRARALVIEELEKLRAGGYDPAAVLSQSVRKGWLDVFPLKEPASRPVVGEVI